MRHLKMDKRSHLSGDGEEKQAILYSTVRIQEAHIKRAAMEKIDATGRDVERGDDNVIYNLGLERVRVNTEALSVTVPRCLVHAWVKNWEK